MKHTKGPWETDGRTIWDGQRVGSVVATLPSCGLHFNTEANATLIAAAPDLLEALENMLDVLVVLTKNTDRELYGKITLDNLETLIKKARGEK